MAEEKKGFKFPSAYTILIILIILVALLPGSFRPGSTSLTKPVNPSRALTTRSNPTRSASSLTV